MLKVIKIVIWILAPLFVLMGMYASINQMPPNPQSYNPGFYENPITTWIHVLPGLLFMVLAPLQLSSKIRSKFLAFHKWVGRVFVFSSILVGISAFLIVFNFPYSHYNDDIPNISEQLPDVFFGSLFIIFTALGYYHIKKKNIEKHREYMIRVFSIGLGISLFRVLMVATAIFGQSPLEFIGLFFWIGFSTTWLIGETYIFLSKRKLLK